MRKLMFRVTLLSLVLIFGFFAFASSFGEEVRDSEIFTWVAWVASKMGLEINPDIPLPQIKIVSSEEMMEVATGIMVRDFKDTPFWEEMNGRSQEEIIRELKSLLAQAEERGDYHLVYDNGLYDPYLNIIYLTNGADLDTFIHEATHFFQVQYQNRYPKKEDLKDISKEEEILKRYQELEEEAERMAKDWKKEFCPRKLVWREKVAE